MSRLIDADKMLKRLEEWNTGDETDRALYNFTLHRIIEQPTVTPEHEKGEWLGRHEPGIFSHPDSITYRCSECDYSVYTVYAWPKLPNFCPECGSDNRGEKEYETPDKP